MKKAKIALSSLAVIAVVGGALAFRTSAKFTPSRIFPKQANGQCTVSTSRIFTTVNNGNPSFLYNTVSSTACPFTGYPTTE